MLTAVVMLTGTPKVSPISLWRAVLGVYTPGEVCLTPLPNAAETALAEAIRRCSGTGFEAALWAFLQRATGADNFVALAFRRAGPPLALSRHAREARAFAHLDDSYLAGAYLLDPIHELHLSQAPAGAYRLSEVAPDAFQRSRYFHAYFRQTTIVDEVDIIAHPRPGVTLALALGRDATSGTPFAARDIDTCRRIAPIVAALAEQHWPDLPAGTGTPADLTGDLVQALHALHGIHLSPRQAEVALLILRGNSTLAIALRLAVSPQTVKVFRRQLYARCLISSQAELFGLLLPVLRQLG